VALEDVPWAAMCTLTGFCEELCARGPFAKPLYGQKLYPGFESLPLRQIFK